METLKRVLRYLLEWVFTLIGWFLLLGTFNHMHTFTSNYGEAAGNALLTVCWGAVAGLLWKTFNLLGMRAFAAAFFEWVATLAGWGLLALTASHLADISDLYGEVVAQAVGFGCVAIFCVLMWKSFNLIGGDGAADNSTQSRGTKNQTATWKKAAAVGIAAKTYQNVLRKPTVIPPPGYVIKGLKQKGFGSTWEVRYGTSERHSTTNTTKINKRTSGFSHGAAQFKVEWP